MSFRSPCRSTPCNISHRRIHASARAAASPRPARGFWRWRGRLGACGREVADGRNGLPAHAHIRLKRLRAGPVKDRRTSEKKVKIHTLNCTTFRPARKSSNPVLMQVLPRRRSCVETRRAPSLPLVAPPLGFPRYRAPEGALNGKLGSLEAWRLRSLFCWWDTASYLYYSLT